MDMGDQFSKSAKHTHKAQFSQQEQNEHRLSLFDRYWKIIHKRLTIDNKSAPQIEKYKQLLMKSTTDQKTNRALGAIYGAIIGDALGAYCQFQSSLPDKTVDEAMQMRGGGTFYLQPGQYTDDSELATHLLQALTRLNIQQNLFQQQYKLICNCAAEYAEWKKNGPFDIGTTCSSGIASIMDKSYYQQILKWADHPEPDGKQPPFLEALYALTYSRNNTSISNGSLMRISPFATFFATLGEDPLDYEQFIKNEIRLTHSNKTLGVAGFFWVNLLTKLINRSGNSQEDFEKVLNQCIYNKKFDEIKDWIQEASVSKQKAMPALKPNMGFAKIAFSYGLRVLFKLASGQQKRINQSLYSDWIRWIIKRAGDTDTNAAIAGGLIGTVVGFWGLPAKYVTTTLKTVIDRRILDLPSEPHQVNEIDNDISPCRPKFYQPFNTLCLSLDLIQKGEQYRSKHIKIT